MSTVVPSSAAGALSSTPQAAPAADPAGGAGVSSAEPASSWIGAYGASIKSRIGSKKAYPAFARRLRLGGNVTLGFEISQDGRLLAAAVIRSSGSAVLDKAALESLRAGAPFPPFPATARDTRMAFQVVLSYNVE